MSATPDFFFFHMRIPELKTPTFLTKMMFQKFQTGKENVIMKIFLDMIDYFFFFSENKYPLLFKKINMLKNNMMKDCGVIIIKFKWCRRNSAIYCFSWISTLMNLTLKLFHHFKWKLLRFYIKQINVIERHRCLKKYQTNSCVIIKSGITKEMYKKVFLSILKFAFWAVAITWLSFVFTLFTCTLFSFCLGIKMTYD